MKKFFVAIIFVFTVFLSAATESGSFIASGDTESEKYYIINAGESFAIYDDVGTEVLTDELSGILSYLEARTVKAEITFGNPDDQIDTNDVLDMGVDTFSLKGVDFVLSGNIMGSPVVSDSVIKFDGGALEVKCNINNASSVSTTSALRIYSASEVLISEGVISGGKGVALRNSSAGTEITINSTLSSENENGSFGTLLDEGMNTDIKIEGTVTNSSISIDARVITMAAGSSGDLNYKGEQLGFYNEATSLHETAEGTVVNTASSGIFEMAGGEIILSELSSAAIINSGNGTVKVSGGRIDTGLGLAIGNMGGGTIIISQEGNADTVITSARRNEGTINSSGLSDTKVIISGGEISNTAEKEVTEFNQIVSRSYVVYSNNANKCDVTVNGGRIFIPESEIENSVIYSGSSGRLEQNGGKIESKNGYVIVNARNGKFEINGGTVTTQGDIAILNQSVGEIIVKGGTVSSGNIAIQNLLSGGKISIKEGVEIIGEIDNPTGMTGNPDDDGGDDSEGGSNPNIPLIVSLSVIGGVLLLAAAAVGVYFYLKKKNAAA